MATKTRVVGATAGVGAASAAVIALTIGLVPAHEGTVLKGYKDPIGVVSACTGHTKTAVFGKRYTPAQCEELLRQDVLEHAEAIAPCIKRTLPTESHAAFLSFAFNVGPSAFCKSTLAAKMNAGDLAGACAQLSRWTLAGGVRWPGLVRRRADERALCELGLLR